MRLLCLSLILLFFAVACEKEIEEARQPGPQPADSPGLIEARTTEMS